MSVLSRILGIVTAFCLLTSFIAVGHGIAPFGLLLIWVVASLPDGGPTQVNEFALMLALITIGAVLLVIGSILPKRAARFALHCGIISGLAGFLIALFVSDTAITTFVFSLHFLGSTIGLMIALHPGLPRKLEI